MADASKPKLLLRSGASFSAADKSSSPGLMLNHGKPNFTIQRSTKSKFNMSNGVGNYNNVSATNFNNMKGEHYNGILKSPKQQSTVTTNNEATKMNKINLRRTKQSPNALIKVEEDSEPEFIRAQRRIQQRLAKDNILDFDKRKSGYFTQVMMSPTSPNSKTTFGETMESPEPMPNLEFASETSPSRTENGKFVNGSATRSKEGENTSIQNGYSHPSASNGHAEKNSSPVAEFQTNDDHQIPVTHTNGHIALEPADASDAKGVNFEPTIVVSFAQELSNEPNKYPDTVKVTKEVETSIAIDEELQELTKLKFDIEADEEMKDVKVTPVLRTNE